MTLCKRNHPRKGGRCKECRNWRDRLSLRQQRFDAITALGGVCTSCGNSDIRALEIDHVYGDGHLHKRNGNVQRKMYRKLKDGTYDGPELQVLCGSCHNIKTLEESWVE